MLCCEMIALHRSPLCSMGALVRTCQCLSVSLFSLQFNAFQNRWLVLVAATRNANNSIVSCYCFVTFVCVLFKGMPLLVREDFLRTHKSSCARPNSSFATAPVAAICLSVFLTSSFAMARLRAKSLNMNSNSRSSFVEQKSVAVTQKRQANGSANRIQFV